MKPNNDAKRQRDIDTQWDLVEQAHHGTPAMMNKARRKLFDLYHPIIEAYFLALVNDAGTAAELYQDFVVRLMEGRFHGADRKRGLFRNYLKSAVFHMVVDEQRKQKTVP